jgi:hypothetical protein
MKRLSGMCYNTWFETSDIVTSLFFLLAIALISSYTVFGVTAQLYGTFNFSLLASYPGDKIQSISSIALRPLKYQRWYPRNEFYLSLISTQTCNLTLRAYEGLLDARKELPPVTNYCGAHLSCLLSTVSESAKGDMASASVLLGLTPSILSSLGPTLAEVSLLSLRRPILAILISLGSPAIYPSRLGSLLQFTTRTLGHSSFPKFSLTQVL